MNTRHHWTVAMIGAALLLSGCASHMQQAANASRHHAAAPTMSMAPGQSMSGMSMAPGEAMAGMSMTPSQTPPSTSATMVCSPEIKSKVKMALDLASLPTTGSTWRDQLYTCTYSLPVGPMVLSVKQSADKAGAHAYFNALRAQLGSTEAVAGLGDAAYATPTGTAVVIKDSMTLRVDTTRLPPVFGSQQEHRTDLAYEIASDVLGCWTGD